MFSFFKHPQKKKKKTGVALGSGGAKGLAHIAVLEYLDENGIRPDFMSGSSIGALIGALYAAGNDNMRRFKNDLLKLDRSVYMKYFEPVFPVSGLLNIDTLLEFVKKYIPEDLEFTDLRVPLCVVATDYHTGKQVLFRSGNVLTAVRASISIPGIFLPLKMEDALLIDGGVANPLPIDVVKEMGAEAVIAVNLHPGISSKQQNRADEMKIPPAQGEEVMKAVRSVQKPGSGAFNLIVDKAKSFVQLSKEIWEKNINSYIQTKISSMTAYPNIFEVILQTMDIMGYSNTVMMLKYDPPDVLIEPDLLELRSLEFDKAGLAFSEGRSACLKVRAELDSLKN